MGPSFRNVHVRVNDESTGRPMPVRVRFTGENGQYFAPFGRLESFTNSIAAASAGNLCVDETRYAYVDGTCEIRLPGDPIRVQIQHGPEYAGLDQIVRLGAGKIALRFAVSRCANLSAQGWWSGDTRVFDVSPDAAFLECQAEDVAVTNLLARSTARPATRQEPRPALASASAWEATNLLAFSGQKPCLEAQGHLVAVNSYHHHPVLGSLSLLHCHRLIFPLRFGPPDTLDDWTLADWCRQCHRKNGLVIWHCHQQSDDKWCAAGEALADAILGDVDAIDLDDWQSADGLEFWYRLLDAGIRLPLACGSGKSDSSQSIGCARTYARLKPGEPLTYSGWVEAVRAGKTFVTSGPLLLFHVDGEPPGATVGAGKKCLQLRASVFGNLTIDRVEIVADGRIVADSNCKHIDSEILLEKEIPADSCQWLAARCVAGNRIVAHTSPAYLSRQQSSRDAAAVEYWRAAMRRTLAWVEHDGRFETPAQKKRLTEIFDAAEKTLLECSSRQS